MIPTSSSPGSGSLLHSRMSKTFPLQLTAKVFDLRPSGTELHPWGNLSQFILRFELLRICDLCCVIVSLIGSGLRSHILSFCLSGCLSVCHQQAHIFPPCSVCDSCPHSSVFPRRKPTVFSMAFLMSSDTFPGRPIWGQIPVCSLYLCEKDTCDDFLPIPLSVRPIIPARCLAVWAA